MPYPDERLCHPIPMSELERRWQAVRAVMAEQRLDALVIQGACNMVGTGGYFRWFTGVSPIGSYPQTVIFPRDGLMTLVMHGPLHGEHDLKGEEAMLPGIGRRLTTPMFPGIGYANAYDAELTAGEIKRSGYRAIGLVGLNHMLYGSGAALVKQLDGVSVREATELEGIGLIPRRNFRQFLAQLAMGRAGVGGDHDPATHIAFKMGCGRAMPRWT